MKNEPAETEKKPGAASLRSPEPPKPRSARKSGSSAPGKSGRITIRLVRSGICTPRVQKETLKGLGFSRREQEVTRPDDAAIRGMIRKVRHLVEVKGGSEA